jgi:hypothetical protein
MRPIPCKASEVHCDHCVCGLGLPVRLRMEGRRHVKLDAAEPEQFMLELASEHRVSIAYYGTQNPV